MINILIGVQIDRYYIRMRKNKNKKKDQDKFVSLYINKNSDYYNNGQFINRRKTQHESFKPKV